MKKNINNSLKDNKELDNIDKLLFNLAAKTEETPEHIKKTIRKTLDEIFK